MERRIDAAIATSQLSLIMDQAVKNKECFIVDRGGEPPVVILSVGELLRMAVSIPVWLQAAWDGARERGLEMVTLEEIDAEVAAYRREAEGTAAAR